MPQKWINYLFILEILSRNSSTKIAKFQSVYLNVFNKLKMFIL